MRLTRATPLSSGPRNGGCAKMLSPDGDDFERGCDQSVEFCERRQSKRIVDFTDANFDGERRREFGHNPIAG